MQGPKPRRGLQEIRARFGPTPVPFFFQGSTRRMTTSGRGCFARHAHKGQAPAVPAAPVARHPRGRPRCPPPFGAKVSFRTQVPRIDPVHGRNCRYPRQFRYPKPGPESFVGQKPFLPSPSPPSLIAVVTAILPLAGDRPSISMYPLNTTTVAALHSIVTQHDSFPSCGLVPRAE